MTHLRNLSRTKDYIYLKSPLIKKKICIERKTKLTWTSLEKTESKFSLFELEQSVLVQLCFCFVIFTFDITLFAIKITRLLFDVAQEY